MEEGDLNGGDISDSPTISDERTLSDSEADPGRASDFFDYTPSQSFNAPVSYLEECHLVMNDLRRDRDLCDVTLVVKSEVFHAHRVVLASRSPYFLGMFKSNMAESQQEEITLTGLDANSFKLILDFMYLNKIKVTESNVQFLLPAASLLQIMPIVEACAEFLKDKLQPSNCLGFQSFADLHHCEDLKKQALQYATEHFWEVCRQEEFLRITSDQLKSLVKSDVLNVRSEEKVYEALLKWVKHDVEGRHQYIPDLMQCVRWSLLPQSYIAKEVVNEPVLKSYLAVKDMIINALIFHYNHPDNSKQNRRFFPRHPSSLVVVGGKNPTVRDTVESYSAKNNAWRPLAKLTVKRSSVGVAFLNGYLYAVGGFSVTSRLSSVERYDPEKNEWTLVAPMSVCRSTTGVGVIGGKLYAVGGRDGTSCLATAECYDPETGVWTPIPPMTMQRGGVAVAVIGDLLYAIGGYELTCSSCTNTVESYNPELEVWTRCAPMTCMRSYLGVGVVDNYLFAVGGRNGAQYFNSVERYDPVQDIWTAVVSMNTRRGFVGVGVLDGCLYAVGGCDGKTNQMSVEKYDPKEDCWTEVAIMKSRCSSLGVATLG